MVINICIEKRNDPYSIPYKKQFLLIFIPQGDGKLPIEKAYKIVTIIFVKMNNNFGVGMGGKVMS